MRIIYMHNAEKQLMDGYKNSKIREQEDITKRGEQEANIISDELSKLKITSIYTSTYKRCKKTAEIINKNHNLEVIVDSNLNGQKQGEDWKTFLNRNVEFIKDIVDKHNNNDVIVCITGSKNLTGFICYFYNIDINDNTPKITAQSISPINFTIDKKR